MLLARGSRPGRAAIRAMVISCARYSPGSSTGRRSTRRSTSTSRPTGSTRAAWRSTRSCRRRTGLEWFAGRPTRPTTVLLSNRHHYRDSARFADGFGCTVRCTRAGLHEFTHGEAVEGFEPGDRLPGGVVACEVGGICPDETALYLPEKRAVILADGVVQRRRGRTARLRSRRADGRSAGHEARAPRGVLPPARRARLRARPARARRSPDRATAAPGCRRSSTSVGRTAFEMAAEPSQPVASRRDVVVEVQEVLRSHVRSSPRRRRRTVPVRLILESGTASSRSSANGSTRSGEAGATEMAGTRSIPAGGRARRSVPGCDLLRLREGESDGFHHCGYCGASLAAPAAERRKLATLVFCDMSGSTAMGERVDAETVRGLMLSYFHEMRAALERHGGTVEKFVGDAVLAVFGVPEAHEDDALARCRAALEMQARLAALNEELRAAVRHEDRAPDRRQHRRGRGRRRRPSRETFVTGDRGQRRRAAGAGRGAGRGAARRADATGSSATR